MSFEAVWGFDPNEVARAKETLRRAPDAPHEAQPEQSSAHEACAQIPNGFNAQVYELRRIFRL